MVLDCRGLQPSNVETEDYWQPAGALVYILHRSTALLTNPEHLSHQTPLFTDVFSCARTKANLHGTNSALLHMAVVPNLFSNANGFLLVNCLTFPREHVIIIS